MRGDIACHGCDLLVNVAALKDGESASCPRCGGFLTRVRDDAFSRVLAYTISGLILLVFANSFSFLSFAASGLESVITLWQTPSRHLGLRHAGSGDIGSRFHYFHSLRHHGHAATAVYSPCRGGATAPGW